MAEGSATTSTDEMLPMCSSVLALRRISLLLGRARDAETQGDDQQACKLYCEALDVRQSLAGAPLGSIGKSLQELEVGVQARVQRLRQRTSVVAGSQTRHGAPHGACGTTTVQRCSAHDARQHHHVDAQQGQHMPHAYPPFGGGQAKMHVMDDRAPSVMLPHRRCEGSRPSTKEVAPERRGQDVSIRKIAGRRQSQRQEARDESGFSVADEAVDLD
mmetsp:Transcript_53776/g.125073  ORF Transcript_53776/g.125073 Transcript_53776/m.125073 type:complete len:216 (+) Transcript_53776:31-678(+)